MLPQTLHKRALLMCATYLFNTFMVHKTIHSQLLSFVGVRLILWGKQNSSHGPSSKEEEKAPPGQDLTEVMCFHYYHTASSRVLNTANFPSMEWLTLPSSPQPPEMQSCDCYRNLGTC